MSAHRHEDTPRLGRASRRDLLALAAGASLASCGTTGERGETPAPSGEDDSRRRADLDEMFAHLSDQRAGHQPIQPAERTARRERLGAILAASGVDAYLCEGGPTMSYLTGMRWGHSERLFGLVVLASGEHFWICPSFEEEKARLRIEPELDAANPGGEIVTWDEDEYAWRPLATALRERGAERVALDPESRFFIASGLALELGHSRVLDGRAQLVELRGRKDAHELALLRRANELTQEALRAVGEHVRPGMTGRDVSELTLHAQRRLGLVGPWCLALVGPAAAYPHGKASQRALEPGDLLLVDTGGGFHGYQSDISRTWAVGGPAGVEEVRAWNAVHAAQLRAFETIRPGVRAGEIDRAARASIESSGYPGGYEVFTHRLGHGIGMQGHEDPYFDRGSEVVLAPGMTLSNEPGIYLYGRFGVRLEDIVAVTEDGAEHFGDWQKGPNSPA